MKTIQGFVSIYEFIKNSAGAFSALGELSTWSRTYSKEQGEYQHTNVPGYQLSTFKVINEETKLPTTVETQQVLEILELVRHCVEFARDKVRPYYPSDLFSSISTQFYGRVEQVVLGDMVDNGIIALPSYIAWNSITNSGNVNKIWLADAAFADQYSDYSITVVPPLENIDALLGNFDSVKDMIDQRSLSAIADTVQRYKDQNPETYYRMPVYDLFDRLDNTRSVRTVWAVLVYGRAGDNVDAIQDAIADYILDNTSNTKALWESVLPDVFKRTEFVVLPRWKKIAVASSSEIANLYSSFTDPIESITHAADSISFYSRDHIEKNTTVLSFPYKGILLEFVSAQTNHANKNKVAKMFSDFVHTHHTSSDFSRMQPRTREWVVFMKGLIEQAEIATPSTILPSNMRRIMRGNKLYVSGVFEGVNYLVDARFNRC